MTWAKGLTLALVIVFIGGFVYFDLGSFLTLEAIKEEQTSLNELLLDNPVVFSATFFLIYVAATAISLPGAATALTLVAGAVFGLAWGVVFVSFASTIGATLAMLIARWLFQEQIQVRFKQQLQTINDGIEREGAFYLFTMRLVVIFPFFAVNLAMAVTKISAIQFYLVSQIGMLAGTAVFVNAGTQLAQISSAGDILSARIIASLALLGVFPLLAKWLVDWMKAQRVYRGFDRPKAFDRDMVVVGAGSGGLISALIAATVNAKVTLIEKNKMGGDCLNTGCVPSKSILRSARFAYDSSRGADLGFTDRQLDVDFAAVMNRVQRVIKEIEPHDSVERYEGFGVDVELGEAMIISPWHVQVNGKVLTTRNIVVATGAEPFVPPIENIDSVDYLTSDTLWQLRGRPDRVVVLGGGPIGTELTQALVRLGSSVQQVELLPNILSREDEEFSALVQSQLELEGVEVLTDHQAESVVNNATDDSLVVRDSDGNTRALAFDCLIVAVGRKAMVNGFGLEKLDVALNANGTIGVDDYLRTNFPNIFAVGDVAGPYQFTHTASHMAWYATVNALFGVFKKFKVDYSVIPHATFCYPEIARVGINERDAMSAGIAYDVTTYDVADLDRAIADEEAQGMVKVLTVPGKDKILGVTIAADHAGELIGEFTLAMNNGLGLSKIMGTIHIYPTFMEMNKFVASEWRKERKPEWALEIARRFHAWRRGSEQKVVKVSPAEI